MREPVTTTPRAVLLVALCLLLCLHGVRSSQTSAPTAAKTAAPSPVYLDGQLTILTPEAMGEVWLTGETRLLRWNASDFAAGDTVTVYAVERGGAAVVDVAFDVAASTAQYAWTVPAALAHGAYRVFLR